MSKNTPSRRIISVAIRPKAHDDRQRLQQALSDLSRQDSTMSITAVSADDQIIVSGTGELHLEIICDRIVREFKIAIDIGEPKVIYLETIRKPAEAEGKYARRAQYAHVKLRLEPRERGSGYQFVDEIKESAVPSEFIEAINFGIQEAMKGGILGGHEMVDLLAVLYDGSYYVGASNQIAFKIAASMAFKEAARKASPAVLEPVMAVTVVTSEAFAGAILGDLSLRRGWIEGMEHRSGSQAIRALVPLAEVLGYALHLRSITQGRAEYSMDFAKYEVAPRPSEPGGNEAGVTANLPKGPKVRGGSTAANLDEDSE
jgi:elongation factor G